MLIALELCASTPTNMDVSRDTLILFLSFLKIEFGLYIALYCSANRPLAALLVTLSGAFTFALLEEPLSVRN